ncbi:ferredoxin--NADP reductase [Rudanella lutea]|uniref:ferredoxin--NADP reductase n=1 Tax=Rudanella lutea TaxID=451374 RepID=UPI0003737D05|nr:ferredoxin--NADP reductase [Rudanella lutea]
MTDLQRTFRVTRWVQETADTRSYWLEPTDQQPVPFRPGQFLTLLVPFHGHEARRSYSISSLPAEGLRITIKRVANGDISRYLLDTLTEGDLVSSLPPAGRFVLDTQPAGPARDILLFGAGSGITPLLPLIRQALTDEPQSRVTLLYSNPRASGIIFRDELNQLHQAYPDQFRLLYVLSRSEPDEALPKGTVLPGRMSNTRLETMLPTLLHHDRAHARVFICGPADYMRMVQFTLLVSGMQAGQLRRENFVVEPLPKTPAPVRAQDRTVRLRLPDREVDIEVPAYVSILQAALDAGIRLPYSCRGGRCSSCAARCTAGRVQMTINDVLTERDLAEGWVLTCTGYPDTDGVVIEV